VHRASGDNVSGEPRLTASPQYAFSQLQRALQAAAAGDQVAARSRAQARVARWEAVIAGMADGRLTIGSRTPVADTPSWVTLEVAHGGFATGRYLAETPLSTAEQERLEALPAEVPGSTDRERLNLWYLSDAGQTELLAALRDERYQVEVPEDGALMVVAWLLDRGHYEAALDMVTELRPLMHRLRLAPRLEALPRPAGAAVRLETVGTVKRSFRQRRPRPQIAAMLQTLQVWHPLYDRLVALWCDTVDDDLPHLIKQDGRGARLLVRGGWPCRIWPADWQQRRKDWLADYRAAVDAYGHAGAHRHPKSNFARLRRALEACERDSGSLSPRDVGWIRRALANTITRHGAPGSEARAALRAIQAVIAAEPTHADLAHVLAGRLDSYPEEGGIPSLDPIAADVTAEEHPEVPAGHQIPAYLLQKAARALEAPVDELVRRGVITSGETLARVLPQLTSQLLAANLDDPQLAHLYAQTYTAFRRRRSLLLLNLEHQVRFEELPWITALAPVRIRRADQRGPAQEALRQVTLLALTAFPHAILPNPLVREIGALANQAGLPLPLVEEVAADIFMGAFTVKWRDAAAVASRTLAGSLYARYYDLPDPKMWTTNQVPRVSRRWGRQTADDFADQCKARAREAQHEATRGSFVAANGTVLEQAQILTTHNLAALVDALQLGTRLRETGQSLTDRAFAWAVERLALPSPHRHAELQAIKNAAYAWRQAIFYASFCDQPTQHSVVARLRERVDACGVGDRFGPAVDGLAHVVAGGRFTGNGTVDGHTGRRFLGWAVGNHWCAGAAAAAISRQDI
jgi:hypothetical protein